MKAEDEINKDNKVQPRTDIHTKDITLKVALAICLFLILGIGVVFLVTQHKSNKQIEQLSAYNQKVTMLLHDRDSALNDFMETFNEIESSINLIKKKENIIQIKSQGNEIPKDRKKQILKDIQNLNYLLDQNKKEIAALTQRINNSGRKLSGFEQKLAILNRMLDERDNSITQLKQQLADKDFKIAELNQRVNSLDDQILKQTAQLNNLGSQLSNLDAEINKAYLISGTYKQLREKGIITKKGWFLGVGGNTKMTTTFSENSFKPIDIRETKSITLSAKNAQFITNHPKDSYQWIKKENKIQRVEITDPNKFWKYTKYAVLETK